MKKFTLVSCFALLSLVIYGQTSINPLGSPVKQTDISQSASDFSVKAGGDIIWQSTFDWANPDDPQGWSLPDGWELVDNMDLGNFWTWRQDSIVGRWTDETAPEYFTSRDDGFLVVPMDYYNYRDGVASDDASDTYIQTPSIDCSDKTSVIVKLNQYYRFCCENDNSGHMDLMVTNDDGVHWATYDLSWGIGHNTFTPIKYRSPEFNISDVAAGMSNVQIRIYFHEVPYYFWAIDDLTLCEAYEFDLKLEDSWLEMNAGFEDPVGHINYVPFSQIGMASEVSGFVGDLSFRGALLNNGMADSDESQLNVQISRNGTEVFNQNSSLSSIWTLERDTLEVADGFLPTEYGDYQAVVTAKSNNPEDTPVDISETYNFTINDSLYQRSDMSAESTLSTSVWANGNTAGDMLAVRYDIQSAIEVNSITARVRTFVDSLFPSFQFLVLKYSEEEDDYIEVISSDVIGMDSTYLGWVTLPMTKDGESEFLEPGEYYAAWRAWADDEKIGMRLGWDQDSRAEFTNHNLIYLSSINTWYSSDKMPMLGMNFNTDGGPTEAAVTFNVDMNSHIVNGEFNPGSDFVEVGGSFDGWAGSGQMEDPEGDGIYTITISGEEVGSTFEYKYRVNGDWDTSEYADSEYNREYTVRYWNLLDDVYNGGMTTGVPSVGLTSDVSVYPNPSNGRFTVKFNNSNKSDVEISIINLSGQVCYSQTISIAGSTSQTIDSDLTKGLYFLKIRDGKTTKLHKLVIQ